MREYEVTVETMNPCGGEQYARREIREIETDDPIAWVRRETGVDRLLLDEKQDHLTVTAEQFGYIKRFTFVEF